MAISNDELTKKEDLHKVLACKARLKILALLERQPMFGHQLVKRLDLSQPTVAYHLGILRRAGLIVIQRQGQSISYRLAGKEKDVGTPER